MGSLADNFICKRLVSRFDSYDGNQGIELLLSGLIENIAESYTSI